MIQLIIAEDEAAISLGIADFIKSLDLPVNILALCRNGEEALRVMEKGPVDILLTDVRMPVMNGLELIKKVREKYPETEVVILSGYSDFSYAQEAVSLGVNRYLLKPPLLNEMYETLSGLCSELEKKKKRSTANIIRGLILDGVLPGESAQLPLFDNKTGYLYLVWAGPFSILTGNSINPDDKIWNLGSIKKELLLSLREDDTLFIMEGLSRNEKLFFHMASSNSLMSAKRLVNALSRYEAILGMPVQIVISTEICDYHGLLDIYGKMRHTMNLNAMIGRSCVSIIGVEADREKQSNGTLGEEEKTDFVNMLKKCEFERISEFLDCLCRRWENERVSQINCEFNVKYLVQELFRCYPFLDKIIRNEKVLHEIDSIIGKSLTFQDFTDEIRELFLNIGRKIRLLRTDKNIRDVIEWIYEDIEKNYMTNTSIEKYGCQLGYHPYYLTNQFAKIKGESPNKMITRLRIRKAKELLEKTDKMQKDIAEMLGYQDVSYFSRVFKECVGVSPSQYRDRKKQENDK